LAVCVHLYVCGHVGASVRCYCYTSQLLYPFLFPVEGKERATFAAVCLTVAWRSATCDQFVKVFSLLVLLSLSLSSSLPSALPFFVLIRTSSLPFKPLQHSLCCALSLSLSQTLTLLVSLSFPSLYMCLSPFLSFLSTPIVLRLQNNNILSLPHSLATLPITEIDVSNNNSLVMVPKPMRGNTEIIMWVVGLHHENAGKVDLVEQCNMDMLALWNGSKEEIGEEKKDIDKLAVQRNELAIERSNLHLYFAFKAATQNCVIS